MVNTRKLASVLIPARLKPTRWNDCLGGAYVENVLQVLLRLGLLDAELGDLEVGGLQHVAAPRPQPAGARDVDQAIAEQQHKQEQAPRVGRRDRQHLQLWAVSDRQCIKYYDTIIPCGEWAGPTCWTLWSPAPSAVSCKWQVVHKVLWHNHTVWCVGWTHMLDAVIASTFSCEL